MFSSSNNKAAVLQTVLRVLQFTAVSSLRNEQHSAAANLSTYMSVSTTGLEPKRSHSKAELETLPTSPAP